MKLKEKVSWLMSRMQRSLFPCLEECCYQPLTKQEEHLLEVLELIEIEKHIPNNWKGFGRPPAERKIIARCCIAKSVLRYQTTRDTPADGLIKLGTIAQGEILLKQLINNTVCFLSEKFPLYCVSHSNGNHCYQTT